MWAGKKRVLPQNCNKARTHAQINRKFVRGLSNGGEKTPAKNCGGERHNNMGTLHQVCHKNAQNGKGPKYMPFEGEFPQDNLGKISRHTLGKPQGPTKGCVTANSCGAKPLA